MRGSLQCPGPAPGSSLILMPEEAASPALLGALWLSLFPCQGLPGELTTTHQPSTRPLAGQRGAPVLGGVSS